MIRVNLLAQERATQKRRVSAVSTPSAPGSFQLYVFLIIFAGGALAICGFLWFLKQAQIRELDNKIAEAEKRRQELQVIKKQVDELERKRQMYKQKVDLIERLRKEQSHPVHLLDEISKALPNFLWLDKMSQAGPGVTLTGSSNGLNPVADFITNLQNSGWFPQVDLGPTREEKSGVITFSLSATFRDPTMPTPTPPPPPPPRAPGGRR
jgi:type IV pilus assembly protein PilN